MEGYAKFKCWYSNVGTQMLVLTEMDQMHCAAIPTTPCAHAIASKACNLIRKCFSNEAVAWHEIRLTRF